MRSPPTYETRPFHMVAELAHLNKAKEIQGSPTQAENGQAGMCVGAGQPIPPSTPSSDGQTKGPPGSPGKGGNVSGLGKGFGGNGVSAEFDAWTLWCRT